MKYSFLVVVCVLFLRLDGGIGTSLSFSQPLSTDNFSMFFLLLSQL